MDEEKQCLLLVGVKNETTWKMYDLGNLEKTLKWIEKREIKLSNCRILIGKEKLLKANIV